MTFSKHIGSALGLLFFPVLARAYTLEFDPGLILYGKSQLGANDPAYIVFTTVNTALIFLGLITVVMIVVAGFMWILAAGEEEKITKAKDLLKGSVLGLIIVLASYGLARFVFVAIQTAVAG
ncbi:MAG: hypothetical protein HYV33_06140 [Candidatus Kerfeldbacteria bacterium]|nr:hypothetical protein [Candidatus Kerfeldbacteria bacterium]